MIFYCMVKDDGTNTVHSRTIYLLEIFLTLLFIALSEIVLGIANIRLGNFFYYILIMLPSPVLAYIFVKNRFNEDKGKEIVLSFPEQINKKKTLFALLAIILFISAFVIIVLCGMFMSYLFSLYE